MKSLIEITQNENNTYRIKFNEFQDEVIIDYDLNNDCMVIIKDTVDCGIPLNTATKITKTEMLMLILQGGY